MELGQLDIDNLFLLARAWSLGRSRRRFSLNGSLYLGVALVGLGALAAFSDFWLGAGFCAALSFLLGASFCPGEAVFSLSALGGRPRRFGDLDCSSCFGPASLEGTGRSRLFRGFYLLLGGGPLRDLLLGHDFREVKDRHAGGLLLLGSVWGLVLRGGSLLCGSFGLFRGGNLGSGLLLLGNLCGCFGQGWGRARAGPVASVTIFAFSSAIRISSFLFDGMKKGPDFLQSSPACRDTSFLCP